MQIMSKSCEEDRKKTIDPNRITLSTSFEDFEPVRYDNQNHSKFPSHLSSILKSGQPFQKSSHNLAYINSTLRAVSISATVAWILLCILCYTIYPQKDIKFVNELEQQAVLIAFSVQIISLITRLITFFYQDDFRMNGLHVANFTVQGVSMLSNLLMGIHRSPITKDPITGCKVHLLRWCEWIPLAFLMTFMTEVVGMENARKNISSAYKLALTQGLSTVFGILFPLCSRKSTWLFSMCLSMSFYLCLFPRLFEKRKQFLVKKMGNTVDEIENYHRAKYAYQLLLICSVMWTFLVICFFFAAAAHMIAPPGSIFANPSMTMIIECFVDVIIKVLYLKIINEIQNTIFDERARARRWLEELRNMMTVVWESSSDIIAISMRNAYNGDISTIVSPNFKHKNKKEDEEISKVSSSAIMFVLKGEDIKNNSKLGNAPLSINPSSVTILNADENDTTYINENPFFSKALSSLGDVIVKAWASPKNENLFMHDLITLDGSSIQSEATQNQFEENAMIVILRDISERFMRFEAEKKVVSETTARLKDAEANRFTRHEVKNGLLAAIELCNGLKSIAENENTGNMVAHESDVGNAQASKAHSMSQYISDLHSTLNEVLDTVLAEAMSKEVIYEVYRPVLERLNIAQVLRNSVEIGHKERFPIESDPSPFPEFNFDQQLLIYIHRNAITNAIKYGKKDGLIRTVLEYDSTSKKLSMMVINLPGEGHVHILAMGEAACEAVFVQGKQLHKDFDSYNRTHATSSGDGAWIVQKCAKTLGGKCDIRFEEHQTVFSFQCPANPLSQRRESSSELDKFQVPENTFGIAIDDSKVQRKLMSRFLSTVGVKSDRLIVQGKDKDEILSFEKYVVDLVRDKPNDYFLIIADENLDMNCSEGRLSGSICIQKILQQLEEIDEARVLALVRSANDSANEFALYNSRAHGFMVKAPMKAQQVNEILRHFWMKRFN